MNKNNLYCTAWHGCTNAYPAAIHGGFYTRHKTKIGVNAVGKAVARLQRIPKPEATILTAVRAAVSEPVQAWMADSDDWQHSIIPSDCTVLKGIYDGEGAWIINAWTELPGGILLQPPNRTYTRIAFCRVGVFAVALALELGLPEIHFNLFGVGSYGLSLQRRTP